MRWIWGVVVCATLARAEASAEAVKQRQPKVALRMSVLAGGGFVTPEPACLACRGSPTSSASVSAGIELAAVLRWGTRECYFANQLVWYPIFDSTPSFALTASPPLRQMLALTAELGLLGHVKERALIGGGALLAYSFVEPQNAQRAGLVSYGNVLMPGLSVRFSFALDEHQVHRVGANFFLLARIAVPGVILLPTLSYSATLPW